MFHGDVMEIELPGRVDVIVSEWLGGFGIDEGMLAPVIATVTAGSSRAES